MATLRGTEVSSSVKHSQVYQATHTGEGKILPYMNRSFISFTFGGKRIEEFNLIATISGDRMDRDGYAPFKDTVSTYDNLNGQYYWSTHYDANQIEFTLSTDGIDQKMLDDFLHWFQAGATRELILAEHPNRAILARVANPPRLSLLPFEQPVEITISSQKYTTSTTLYKGDITLSLVMDEPHWYALENILGRKTQANGRDFYEDYWVDVNGGAPIWIFSSKDALKILYEDGIPLGSMIAENMLLGNKGYARIENEPEGRIWSLSEEDENFIAFGEAGFPGTGVGARIVANDATSNYTAYITGAMVDISGNGIGSLNSTDKGYFFYAGTAPAPTIISFTLTPKIDDSTYYIVTPRSSFDDEEPYYNTLTIASETTQEFRFTTPNLFTSYNKVIQIFNKMINQSYSWEEVRKKIRDDVRHAAVRAWANKVIEGATNNLTATATVNNLNTLLQNMSYLFKNSTGTVWSASFEFNSQTGKAQGTFKYRTIKNTSLNNVNWSTFNANNSVTTVEDVGDMLKSNYIIIRDRNYPTSDGKIYQWKNVDGKRTYSHVFYHNCDVALTNISILYKNMYL